MQKKRICPQCNRIVTHRKNDVNYDRSKKYGHLEQLTINTHFQDKKIGISCVLVYHNRKDILNAHLHFQKKTELHGSPVLYFISGLPGR